MCNDRSVAKVLCPDEEVTLTTNVTKNREHQNNSHCNRKEQTQVQSVVVVCTKLPSSVVAPKKLHDATPQRAGSGFGALESRRTSKLLYRDSLVDPFYRASAERASHREWIVIRHAQEAFGTKTMMPTTPKDDVGRALAAGDAEFFGFSKNKLAVLSKRFWTFAIRCVLNNPVFKLGHLIARKSPASTYHGRGAKLCWGFFIQGIRKGEIESRKHDGEDRDMN